MSPPNVTGLPPATPSPAKRLEQRVDPPRAKPQTAQPVKHFDEGGQPAPTAGSPTGNPLFRPANDEGLELAKKIAADPTSEREQIVQLALLLEKTTDLPPADRRMLLEEVAERGKGYLALARFDFGGPQENEKAQATLNRLAANIFAICRTQAGRDATPEGRRLTQRFEGFLQLAQGEIDEATKTLSPLQTQFPDVRKIVRTIERDRLRGTNLAALGVMREYTREGRETGLDEASGLGGWVASWFAKRPPAETVRRRATEMEAFIDDIEKRIESGRAVTIDEAVGQIRKESPQKYTDLLGDPYLFGDDETNIWRPLIRYVSKTPPDRQAEKELLMNARNMGRYGAETTPYLVHRFVAQITEDPETRSSTLNEARIAEGKGDLPDYLLKAAGQIHTGDLPIMVAAGAVGNLARLRTLAGLGDAGVTGYKAVALGLGAGIGAEGTTFWAAKAAEEAWGHDASRALNPTHLLQGYGATLLMIGGLKGFGKLGEALAPRAKVVAFGIGHSAGLGGMVAMNQASQALGLAPAPKGGWRESLAGDLVTFVQFAVAHKVADQIVDGRLTTVNQRVGQAIRRREAKLTAMADPEGTKPEAVVKRPQKVLKLDEEAVARVRAEAAVERFREREQEINGLRRFYEDPLHGEALKRIAQGDGPFGAKARECESLLRQLDADLEAYYKLESSGGPATLPERAELAGRICETYRQIRRDGGYNETVALPYAERIQAAEATAIEMALTQMELALRGQTGNWVDHNVRYRPADEILDPAGSGLADLSPNDLFSVDVEVSNVAMADAVRARLGQDGLVVLSNHDTMTTQGTLARKEILVQDARSGRRIPVTLRIVRPEEAAPPDFSRLEPSAIDTLPPSEQRDFIRHLQSERGWNWQQVQDLIGVEKMRALFGFGEKIPFGFQSEAEYQAFAGKLMSELLAAGVPIYDPRVRVVVQGSAARGSDQRGGAFRWEVRGDTKPSDIDVAIIVDDPDLFNTFVQRRVRSEAGQGQVDLAKSSSRNLRQLHRHITVQRRMSSYDMDDALRTAHNRVRDTLNRRVQMSMMLPDSPFVPPADEAMVISADLATGPN